MQMITWWAASSVLAGFLEPQGKYTFGPIQVGWNFFLLYHFSRCSLTYICYIFRESIDHSGLQPTGILQFSRNTPCCNWFQYFLQPHEDCYHLLHHLLPRVPVTKLHQAHVWLTENNEPYQKTNRMSHCFSSSRTRSLTINQVTLPILMGRTPYSPRYLKPVEASKRTRTASSSCRRVSISRDRMTSVSFQHPSWIERPLEMAR